MAPMGAGNLIATAASAGLTGHLRQPPRTVSEPETALILRTESSSNPLSGVGRMPHSHPTCTNNRQFGCYTRMVSPFHGKAIQRRSVEPIFFVLNNNRYFT
jgi:hypothetical protein